MAKLQSPKRLKTTTWEAMSRYVRARDNYRCVTCGAPGNEAGHYKHNSERSQSLGGNELWYDERNINCQCSRCNKYLSSNSTAYALFLEKKYGHGILQDLNKLWLTPKKWTRHEIGAKRAYFEQALKDLTPLAA